MTDYVKQITLQSEVKTKKHIDKNSDFQAFSKHHIGLLYTSLVCPNLVCEPVLAEPLALFSLSVSIDLPAHDDAGILLCHNV